MQRELKASELDEASCQHILTAQCALLDEAVKGRGVEDDACIQWYDIPLQGYFLGTMDAGDTLCDRMRDVLREPAPDHAVVTCFQRVMMLGFLGNFRSLNDPERQKLMNALNEYVAPFSYSQPHPVLAESHAGQGIGGWLASWPVRIGLSVVVVSELKSAVFAMSQSFSHTVPLEERLRLLSILPAGQPLSAAQLNQTEQHLQQLIASYALLKHQKE